MLNTCVYATAHPDLLARAVTDGVGILENARPWEAAQSQFKEARLRNTEYLLFFGDSVRTTGVEWVALVDGIDIDHGRTVVRFKYAVPFRTPFAYDLRKASDGQQVGQGDAPYLLCTLGDWETKSLVRMLKKRGKDIQLVMEVEAIKSVTAAQWREAIEELSISSAQRAMLIEHALAPGRTRHVGEADAGVAMRNYRSLCKKFSEFFGATTLADGMEAVATNSEDDEDEEQAWTLLEPLAEALVLLGWIDQLPPKLEHVEDSRELAAARREIYEDPTTREAPETVRQALVDARIGQGQYRRALEKIWGNTCALTGVRVREALTASHILAWSEANNEQRLDEYNGLLLAASVDRLFDAGLVSFDDKGKLLTKPELDDGDLRSLGIRPGSSLQHVSERHQPYLAMHREKFGFSTRR